MFTGIVTDKGRITAVQRGQNADQGAGQGMVLELATSYDTASIDIGASVACSGVCLTVVGKTAETITFDVSQETVSKTTLGDWVTGDFVNLERPLKVGDELGGHIVSGHVDGVVEVLATEDETNSRRFKISLPREFAPYIAPKGSVTLDGVSLTVNGVGDGYFDVNIVPHTRQVTSFGEKAVGDRINLEIDVLARYLDRLNQFS